jgi:hypothetical protein
MSDATSVFAAIVIAGGGVLFWTSRDSERLKPLRHRRACAGHVAELVGIEGGVVSGVINLESSGA